MYEYFMSEYVRTVFDCEFGVTENLLVLRSEVVVVKLKVIGSR